MLITSGISPSFADMGLAIEQAIVPPHPRGTGPSDLPPHPRGTGPSDLPPDPRGTGPSDLPSHSRGTGPSDLSPHPGGTGPSDLPPHPGGTGPSDLPPHPGGTGPSPALASCKRHTDITSLDHQLVLSYCWLALKVHSLAAVCRRRCISQTRHVGVCSIGDVNCIGSNSPEAVWTRSGGVVS